MDDLNSHDDATDAPTDRSFGLLWTCVFAIIAIWPIFFGSSGGIQLWAVAAAGGSLAITTLRPHVLAPLNRAWMRLAKILSRIVTPVVMGMIFFSVVWPTGVVRRLSGADPLHRRSKGRSDSYWIKRPAAGDGSAAMKNQF